MTLCRKCDKYFKRTGVNDKLCEDCWNKSHRDRIKNRGKKK